MLVQPKKFYTNSCLLYSEISYDEYWQLMTKIMYKLIIKSKQGKSHLPDNLSDSHPKNNFPHRSDAKALLRTHCINQVFGRLAWILQKWLSWWQFRFFYYCHFMALSLPFHRTEYAGLEHLWIITPRQMKKRTSIVDLGWIMNGRHPVEKPGLLTRSNATLSLHQLNQPRSLFVFSMGNP